jgi:hypothetical protein
MKSALKTLVLLVGFFPVFSFAQDQLVEYTEEGRSESVDSVQQRQDIIQDAIEKVSSKLSRELIGDARFERLQANIKAKVFTQSDKYIPFVKTGPLRVNGTHTLMNVTMRVSPKSLESLLQQAGFMSSAEGAATILPVVSFSDLVNHKSYQWWMTGAEEGSAFLKLQERAYFENLKNNFTKFGFQVQDPVVNQSRKVLPANLQVESLRTQDYQAMGDALKAQIVIKGDVKIENGKTPQVYRISSRFSVYHVGNGRVVADSLRNSETDPGLFATVVPRKLAALNEDINQDLATQVNEAWTRGTLGATLIRLAIKGNFDFKALEAIKEDIRTQVRSVRSLSERLFTRTQVEFDVDVEGGAEALAKSLSQAHWRGLQLRVDSVESGRVTLR